MNRTLDHVVSRTLRSISFNDRSKRLPRAVSRTLEQLECRRLLSGAVTITPTSPISGDTNLSTEGTLDWFHAGYSADPSKIHVKSGVTGPRLTGFTPIGGAASTTTTPGKTFTWNNPYLAPQGDVTLPSDPVIRVDGQNDPGDPDFGPPPAAETEIHAFDNDTQKYLNFLDLNSGVIVTPAANNGNGTTINGIRFYTANDAVERDPGSYVLEGSNDSGISWTTISSDFLTLPDGRNASGHVPDPNVDFNQTLTFDNNISYKSYRVTFPTIKAVTTANSMQIGEIELLNLPPENATATSDAVATIGDGTGYQFTAPASPALRRLKVYVGVDGGAGTLTATLSDGSVVPQTAILNDTNASGATLAVYTIDFKSNTDNQTLSVNWTPGSGATAIFSAADWIELTAPPAPSGVTAVATGKGKVNVSWTDASFNETGFVIERAPDVGGSPGTFVSAGTTAANVTQFLDTGLAVNTKYYYRVRSQNSVGASLAAGSPASVTTRNIGVTGVQVQYWNDPNDGVNPLGHLGSAGGSVVFAQIVPNINVNWGNGSADPSVGTNTNGSQDFFSSQWDATYTADYTGPTSFFTSTDDGGRFFIDLNQNGTFDYDPNIAGTTTPQGELVVNSWTDQGLGLNGTNNGRGVSVNLVAGQQYKIRLQQYEHGGGAGAFLYVQQPVGSLSPAILGTESVIPPDVVPPKLIGDPQIDRPLPATAVYTPKQHIVLHFSEPIFPVTRGSIILMGSTGFAYPPAVTNDPASNSIILTFPELPNQELFDANYRISIPASAIKDMAGNPLDGNSDGVGGDDYITPVNKSFYSLRGDTQASSGGTYVGDRKVDFADFQRIELNFGKTAADRPSESDGDLNYDGAVDQLDLQVLLANMGNHLALPSAPVPSAPISSPAPTPAAGKSAAAPPVKVTKPVVKVPAAPPTPVVKPVLKTVVIPPPQSIFSATRVTSNKDWLASQ